MIMTELGELSILVKRNCEDIEACREEIKKQGSQHEELRTLVLQVHEEIIKYKAFVHGALWVLSGICLVIGFGISQYDILKNIAGG